MPLSTARVWPVVMRASSLAMWTLEQSARLWRVAVTQVRGAEDILALIRVMQEWAGVTVRGACPP